jgi:periplasmic protein TonB
MRTVTLTLSIVAHVIGACALIIAPLYATDTLPEPRSVMEFIRLAPLEIPTTPPARLAPTPAVRPDAAPLVAPQGIGPEEPAQPPSDARPPDDSVITFGGGDIAIIDVTPPPPPQPAAPVRVGGEIRPPQKVTDVPPSYPPIARAAHVEGIVILEAVIGEDGAVRDVRVLRSIPLLDLAAVDAVRQWRFTPTLLNGQPVPIVMTVTVAFRLR